MVEQKLRVSRGYFMGRVGDAPGWMVSCVWSGTVTWDSQISLG